MKVELIHFKNVPTILTADDIYSRVGIYRTLHSFESGYKCGERFITVHYGTVLRYYNNSLELINIDTWTDMTFIRVNETLGLSFLTGE